MGGIRINIHDPKDSIVIEKRGENNVSMINNVFTKWKTKRKKSNIDVNNNSWWVIGQTRFSSKG